MASAQRRSGTRGRPPPKRWVFTRTGSSGARTAQSASEMRNPVVVRLLGVRARARFVGCSDVCIPESIPGYSDRLLVATSLGGYAWNDAGHIWYSTLRQLWPRANFQDCADVSYQVAGTLFGSASTQQQA